MGFKLGYHTADLCLVLEASSFEGLLESALDGYRFLLAGETNAQTGSVEIVTFDALDKESMLVNFLNKLIFLFDTKQFLPSSASIKINGDHLSAKINGSIYNDDVRHCVKAATYHGLEVVNDNNQLSAVVILDD